MTWTHVTTSAFPHSRHDLRMFLQVWRLLLPTAPNSSTSRPAPISGGLVLLSLLPFSYFLTSRLGPFLPLSLRTAHATFVTLPGDHLPAGFVTSTPAKSVTSPPLPADSHKKMPWVEDPRHHCACCVAAYWLCQPACLLLCICWAAMSSSIYA
jgi:hypothetical protein